MAMTTHFVSHMRRLALVEQEIYPPELLTTHGAAVPPDAALILRAPGMKSLKAGAIQTRSRLLFACDDISPRRISGRPRMREVALCADPPLDPQQWCSVRGAACDLLGVEGGGQG